MLEFCDCGTLRDALDQGMLMLSPDGPAPARPQVDYLAVLDTAADIAKGMLQLHALNVLHSDLKVGADSGAASSTLRAYAVFAASLFLSIPCQLHMFYVLQ